MRAAVPAMRSRGGGSVVALTSLSVKQPIDNLLLSNTMRAAVVGLVKTLSREFAPDRIRMNAVAPGYIATDRLVEIHKARADREGRRLEDVQAEETRSIPLGRFGRPGEVARASLWLLSDEASYSSGSFIDVSGGR